MIDTVGAGDAFTAAMVAHYLNGSNVDRMSEAANFPGAFAATQRGGTPPIPTDILQKITATG